VFESQFGPDRLSEGAHRRFRAGIGGHQRQTVECRGRTHIDDAAAPAGPHVGERYARAVDGAVIGHVRHPLELDLRHIHEAAIDAVAGAVDPHVDGTEPRYDRVGGVAQGRAVCDIGLRGGRPRAESAHVFAGRRQPFGAARDKAHPPAALREEDGGATPDAGRSSRDDDDTRNHDFHRACDWRVFGRRTSTLSVAALRADPDDAPSPKAYAGHSRR